MSKLILLGFGFLLVSAISNCLYAQTIATAQSGNWNSTSTWSGGTIPTSANSTLIQLDHDVTIPSGFTATVDQVTVSPGVTLTVASGGTLSLQNSGGTDLTLQEDLLTLFIGANFVVSGDFINNSLTAVDYGAGLASTTFNSGGRYVHAVNGLTLPFNGTTWNANSTCEITGITSTAPGNTNQAFGHFIWNCANQNAVNLVLGLNSASIAGNLSLLNTKGPGIVTLTNTAGTVAIAGNFIVSGNSRFLGTTTVNATINVGGDFNFASTATNPSLLITQTSTVNFNVAKNFSVTSGTFQSKALASATVNVNFTGTTAQTFNTSGGTITGNFNWTIKNGAIVDMGTSPFINAGNFTLEAGGTMKVGSPDGLVQGSSLGNIRVTGSRNYTANGNIIYNSGATQFLGDEWSSTGALNAVAVNLEIANTGSGSVINNVPAGTTNVLGKLTLTSGSLAIGNSNTLDVKGNFAGNGATITGDGTANLIFSGAGTITGSLLFTGGSQSLNNLTINRGADVTLGSGLSIEGTLGFGSSGSLIISSQSLIIDGNITQTGGGGLKSTTTSTNLTIAGSGALSALPFVGTPEFNNVTFNRGSGTFTWGNAGNVNGTLTLSSGSLTHNAANINMISGSTFARSQGTTFGSSSPNTTGSYNVTYTGDLTAGAELPTSSTALNNLTMAGNVILAAAITINGNLNINSGSLNASTFDLTMAGPQFNVVSGTFTISSTKTITFSRAGTTQLGGASIGGTQFGNVIINSGATVGAPNANINVSGTWTNNGTFTANGGIVTFNGGSQNINPNGQAFNAVTFAGSGVKTLQGQLDATGALIITSTLNVGANNPINVSGSWLNNGIFVCGGGTVTFNGAGQAIISNGQPFFNLTLSNSGTKVLGDDLTVGGALTINNPVTLDVSGSTYTINIAGNWINNGTFNRQTGTVNFNGTTTISGSGAANFHNVTITGSGLTAPSGTMDVSGDWLQSSGTFTHSSGTLQFSGNTQSITPAAQTFNNVTVSGTNIKTLQGTTVIAGVLTLSGGTFNTNGQAVSIAGNFVSGAASVLTASTITFNGSTTLSGGTTPTFGAITISGSLTPSSNFNVNGSLVNNGTLNSSAGTVTFGGTTTISGSTTTNTFNNVTITGTLNASTGTLNVGGNWSNSGTFNPSTGTVGFTGTTSITGTTNFNHIIISGTLNGPATLNVAGNFTNNGTFAASTGTLVFNGTSTQLISGSTNTTFNNISVTNSSVNPAVQVQSNQSMAGVLTLSTNSVFDADGSTDNRIFTMLSSADNPTIDASVAALPTGASVSGQVTVQRYMSIEGNNSGRIYRYISSPVQSATVSQIQAFIPVTGGFTGADTGCTGCGTAQSMFLYDESVLTDINSSGVADFNDGYTNFPVANSSLEAFAPGRGYTIFVRANIAPISGAGSALWSLRGPINSGSVSLPVTYTPTGGPGPGNPTNDGWNLVGNPYPATIDWDAGGWTRSNLDNTTYMLDNGLGSPVYATHVAGGASANGGTRYIAAGQAFFVKSNGGTPSLQAVESVKASGTQTTFFRTEAIKDIMRITLKQGTKADETVIQFKAGATANFDVTSDAHKLDNPTPMFSLATISSGARYVINGLPMPTIKTEIPLDVTSVTAGTYSLEFTEFDSFVNPLIAITLRDDFLGTSTNIRTNPNYTFQVTTDTKSFGNARFTVVFDVSQVTGLELEPEHIVVYPNPTKDVIKVEVKSDNDVNAKVLSLTGALLFEQGLQGDTVKKGSFNLEEQADGLYILIIQDGTQMYQKRIIKKK